MSKDLADWLPVEGERSLQTDITADIRDDVRSGLNTPLAVTLTRAQWGFVCGMLDHAAPRQIEPEDRELGVAINKSIAEQSGTPPRNT